MRDKLEATQSEQIFVLALIKIENLEMQKGKANRVEKI